MTRELLFSVTKKDFRVDTFRAGGKGGQNQNKRDTGVRITHLESGAVGEARDSRSQGENKKKAFRRLLETKEWKTWYRITKAKYLGQMIEVEERVENLMFPENIKIEVKENGKWVTTQL